MPVPTHMVQQILNDDLVSGGGSFHQGSKTGTRLPVGETKACVQKCLQCHVTSEINKNSHLTFASAWLSSRNLTICWCPVPVQWNRAVHPLQSLRSNSAPCFRWERKPDWRPKQQAAEPFLEGCHLMLYLKQEVGDAFIATAGGQHQGGQPFGCGCVDIHTSLQQEVDNVVMADIRGVHQRGPTADVLAVQIHLTPATAPKSWEVAGVESTV